MYLLFFSLDNLDQNFMLSLSNALLSYFLNNDIQNLFYSILDSVLNISQALMQYFLRSFLLSFLSFLFFSFAPPSLSSHIPSFLCFLPLLPVFLPSFLSFLPFLPSFFGFLLYFSVFLVAITFLISFAPLLQTFTICVYFNLPLISLSGCSHVSGRTKRACCLWKRWRTYWDAYCWPWPVRCYPVEEYWWREENG